MDHVRQFLTRLKTGENSDDDDEHWSGPSIGIAAGQVKEDVHYMESRGSIDLSNLRFYAVDYPQQMHQSSNLHVRVPNNSTIDDYNNGRVDSVVDIAVFQVPEHCTSDNCDLSKFGVGSLQHMHGASYLNLCQGGRLHLNDKFTGHATHLTVPAEGNMPDRIKQRQYNKIRMPETKHYEVMLANCAANGRKVRVSGQVVFDLVDDGVDSLTRQSLTVLVSVAAVIFCLFVILTVRVNMGTRADFERAHYGLVPDDDDDEAAAPEDAREQQETSDDTFEDEGIQEPREPAGLSRMTQATIV